MNAHRNEERRAGEEAEELDTALVGLPSAPSPVEPASVGSPILPDVAPGPVRDLSMDDSSSPGDSTTVPEQGGSDVDERKAWPSEQIPGDESGIDLRAADGPAFVEGTEAGEGGAGIEVPSADGTSSENGDDTDRSQERMAAACGAVVGLFERLGADVAVEPEDTDAAIVCHVKIKRGAGVLEVGPRGQVLESIQYLVNRMVGRDADRGKRITIEVGGVRDDATEPAMIEMAQRLGESARRIGKTLTIVPIQARDRRVIHTSLAAMDGLRTRSEGEGILRRLLIELADDADEVNDGNP